MDLLKISKFLYSFEMYQNLWLSFFILLKCIRTYDWTIKNLIGPVRNPMFFMNKNNLPIHIKNQDLVLELKIAFWALNRNMVYFFLNCKWNLKNIFYLRDNDTTSKASQRLSRSLADISVSGNKGDLSSQHDISGPGIF